VMGIYIDQNANGVSFPSNLNNCAFYATVAQQ
jgi:hypothetical protein